MSKITNIPVRFLINGGVVGKATINEDNSIEMVLDITEQAEELKRMILDAMVDGFIIMPKVLPATPAATT